MTRALVTGANGHVGANLVRELLARDYEVVAFVRESSDLTGLHGLDISHHKGDVLDGTSLGAAADGCDVIFHTAAVYRTWARDPAEILAPALEGTRNVVAAAKKAGIERIVYTSSVASVGMSDRRDVLRNEEDWNDDLGNPYIRAKTESEREAHRLAEEAGVGLLVVCPGVVIGPWDYRITPSTRYILDWVNGGSFLWEGALNFVAASDVAKVHALVAEKGEPGRRYLATGHNVYIPDVADLLDELAGVRPMDARPIPFFVQWLLALVVETIAHVTGNDPPFTRSVIEAGIGKYQQLDDSWTREALGYEPRPLEETVTETIAWLASIGALKKKAVARLAFELEPDPAWLPPRRDGEPPAPPPA